MDGIGRQFTRQLHGFISALTRSLLLWNKPFSAFILSGLIFTGISSTAGAPWRVSTAPYYNLLADAFLHGQLFLRIIPDKTVDLSLFQGHYYLYWGPLPALFSLPLVAIFGAQVSDVLQTLFFSAVNVGVLAAVLSAAAKRSVIQISAVQRAILVLFFALGTAYTPITASGHVWQFAQVLSLFFTFLAYLAAFKLDGGKAFFFTGCAIAGVLLTRMSAVFIAVYLVWYLLHRNWAIGWRKLIGYCIYGLIPVLLTFALIAVYNDLRFGSFLDTGLNYHLMTLYFVDDFHTYGVLNIHFVPENFFYTYIFYPYSLDPLGVTVRCGSLFLLSPLFFMALFALWQDRKKIDTWMLFLSVILGNIPVLLLMGPGSSLFGPRYTLDFIMPLLLLTALGMRKIKIRYTSILTILSILQYLFGSLIYVHGVP